METPEVIEPKSSTPFWVALVVLVTVSLGAQIAVIAGTRPHDVLHEVRRLFTLVEERTGDRFYRSEFDDFLEKNPELTPPRFKQSGRNPAGGTDAPFSQ